MIKTALLVDTVRHIRRHIGRFLAMTSIVLLGAAFFVGIRATGPDMRLTAQKYYDERNFSDIRLLSTLGFSEDDLSALSGTAALDQITPGYTADVLVEFPERSAVIRLMSFEAETQTVNTPLLMDGRLPEFPWEAAADELFLEDSDYRMGDTISLLSGDGKPLSDTLTVEQVTIIGVVRSPLYTTAFVRGGSSIGSGSVDAFLLLPAESFALEAYTEIHTTILKPDGIDRFDPAYETLISPVKKTLEDLGDTRAPQRYEEIVDDANEKLEEARELITDAEKELADAAQKLEDAQIELEDSEAAYADAVSEFEERIADGQRQLDEAEAELENAQHELDDNDRALAGGEASLLQAQQELDQAKAQAEGGQRQLDELLGQIEALTLQLEALPIDSEEYAALFMQAGAMQATYTQQQEALSESAAQIAAGQRELDAQGQSLAAGRAEWERGREAYLDGRAQLEQSIKDFQSEKENGEASLLEAREDLDRGAAELADGRAEYQANLEEHTPKLEDARAEIIDGEQELAELPAPEWYVLDLYANPAFADYKENCNRIVAVGELFPLIFFLVAALISLTSMSRTVEEDRTQIGIYKALGYARGQIAVKYLTFALLATVLGLSLGLTLGFNFFPRVIASAYGMLYRFPPLIAPMDLPYSLLAIALSLISTISPALYVSYKSLRERPAFLMLPKAPPPGRKIILEFIRPLWERMKFIQKITARNILRYKKRMLMTLIGIAGCTSLVFTGFGLNESVHALVSDQFGRVMFYDCSVQLSATATPEKREQAIRLFEDSVAESLPLQARSVDVDVDGGGAQLTVSLICPLAPEDLEDFIRLRGVPDAKKLALSGEGVILSDKASRLIGVQAGDTLRVRVAEGRYLSVPVTALAENYLSHYLYVSPEVYAGLFGEPPEVNTVFGLLDQESDRSALAEKLLASDGISGINFLADFKEEFADAIGALGYVVAVLIVSAAALAFVVLFSLSGINIEERRREIATIKVLGFYDREVSEYVNRETLILSLCGALVGLLLGVVLLQFVITTAEIDLIVFSRETSVWSYVWGFLLTIVFTLIVNFIMGFKLKKIDMVESLKSVE